MTSGKVSSFLSRFIAMDENINECPLKEYRKLDIISIKKQIKLEKENAQSVVKLFHDDFMENPSYSLYKADNVFPFVAILDVLKQINYFTDILTEDNFNDVIEEIKNFIHLKLTENETVPVKTAHRCAQYIHECIGDEWARISDYFSTYPTKISVESIDTHLPKGR